VAKKDEPPRLRSVKTHLLPAKLTDSKQDTDLNLSRPTKSPEPLEEKYSAVVERMKKIRGVLENWCNVYFAVESKTPKLAKSFTEIVPTPSVNVATIVKKHRSKQQQTKSDFRLNLSEATISSGDSAAGYFVKMYLADKIYKKHQEKKSKVITARNPKWNESFVFSFDPAKQVEITLEIMEENKGKSTLLGKITIPPKIYDKTKMEIKAKGHEKRGELVVSGEVIPNPATARN